MRRTVIAGPDQATARAQARTGVPRTASGAPLIVGPDQATARAQVRADVPRTPAAIR